MPVLHRGRFFRPSYQNALVRSWLPSLDGLIAKLERGATVADVGCGHGFSTVIMAKAFPNLVSSATTSIPTDRRGTPSRGRAWGERRTRGSRLHSASEFPGRGLDLVTFFDCLHDMGDPLGAARHVRQTLKPDGSWMVVEPAAADRLEDNINPVSRLYYAASTMICVPTSLDQPVGAALGAQAGLEKLSSTINQAGFRQVRKATETPFNIVIEARP